MIFILVLLGFCVDSFPWSTDSFSASFSFLCFFRDGGGGGGVADVFLIFMKDNCG